MPARRLSRIGAHLPVSRGLVRGTLGRAAELGVEVAQIFVANPRGWAPPQPDPAGDEAFRVRCAELGLPVFVHAPYLINFGSPTAATLEKSVDALAFSLRRGAAVGASGVVVHAGSAVLGNDWDTAMAQVRKYLPPLIADDGPRVLIEPTAGGGGALASTIESLGAYLDVLDDPRIGVCLDTCHLHAAGHDLSNEASMTSALAALAKRVGRGRIGLVHVNDSRDPAGSKRDRHAGLGAGTIGLDAFAALFSAPALRGIPLVVETEEAGQAADIAALKQLRG